MKRNVVILGTGLLVLTAAACLAAIRLGAGTSGGTVARITLGGELVEEVDLEALSGRWERVVTGKTGLSNKIVAEHGEIWVEEADCPDQICVRQGPISDGTVPIVCLPNQLVIELTGGGGDLDAANG